ncbi:hypothetical protein NEIG_01695 [Nematocida sp. ERTm5]|nr:hypothetical protein NEIG_01695 [Nematocida sp. ERTm5]
MKVAALRISAVVLGWILLPSGIMGSRESNYAQPFYNMLFSPIKTIKTNFSGIYKFPAPIRSRNPSVLVSEMLLDNKPEIMRVSFDRFIEGYGAGIFLHKRTESEFRLEIFLRKIPTTEYQQTYMNDLLLLLEMASEQKSIFSLSIENMHLVCNLDSFSSNSLLENILSLTLTNVTSSNDAYEVNALIKFLALFPNLEILTFERCNLNFYNPSPVHNLALSQNIASLRISNSRGPSDADNLIKFLSFNMLQFLWLNNSGISTFSVITEEILYKKNFLYILWIEKEKVLADISFDTSKCITNSKLHVFFLKDIYKLKKSCISVNLQYLPDECTIYFLSKLVNGQPDNKKMAIASIIDSYTE